MANGSSQHEDDSGEDGSLNFEPWLRLGCLTYRAKIVTKSGKLHGILFQCDCSRYVKVKASIIRRLKDGTADLPWSCEVCKKHQPKVNNRPVYIKRRKRKDGNEQLEIGKMPTGDKFVHQREWWAWQQARRTAGCVERWQTFKWFYADMGDAPPGHRLNRKDYKRLHGPSNSYWMKANKLHWGPKDVSMPWLTAEFGIRKSYLLACTKAKLFDAKLIVERFRAGMPPPTPERAEVIQSNSPPTQFLD